MKWALKSCTLFLALGIALPPAFCLRLRPAGCWKSPDAALFEGTGPIGSMEKWRREVPVRFKNGFFSRLLEEASPLAYALRQQPDRAGLEEALSTVRPEPVEGRAAQAGLEAKTVEVTPLVKTEMAAAIERAYLVGNEEFLLLFGQGNRVVKAVKPPPSVVRPTLDGREGLEIDLEGIIALIQTEAGTLQCIGDFHVHRPVKFRSPSRDLAGPSPDDVWYWKLTYEPFLRRRVADRLVPKPFHFIGARVQKRQFIRAFSILPESISIGDRILEEFIVQDISTKPVPAPAGPGSPAAPRAGLEAGPPGGGQEAAGGRRVVQAARIAEEAARSGIGNQDLKETERGRLSGERDVPAVAADDPGRGAGLPQPEVAQTSHRRTRFPPFPPLAFQIPDHSYSRQVENRSAGENPGPEEPSHEWANHHSGKDNGRGVGNQPDKVLAALVGQSGLLVHPDKEFSIPDGGLQGSLPPPGSPSVPSTMGPGSPAAPRAGLEAGPPGGGQEAAGGRRVAQVARIAEEAAEPGWAVVVSAAALEENPALQAVVSRWVEMAPSVVVFGDSPAARETIAANARLSWARSGQELLGILAGLEERRGVRSVTFLGSAERALPVAPLVQEIGLSLTVTPPSLTKLLAAFIPGPLAAELAAGLEQEEAFAGEA